MLVLHSVPLVDSPTGLSDPTPILLQAIRAVSPRRVVYLSTTGVYGATKDVDEYTAPAPRSLRETLRIEAESAVAAGPWQSLILRPAAIYGPGRGLQESVRHGTFRVQEGGESISRIHVEDLAAHVVAGFFSTVTGAYPVADECPCPSLEVARFAADLLGLPRPAAVPSERAPETLRSDRRVNGRGIREKLGLGLRFPTYREGVRQSLSLTKP
jgi:nucleoside-diphosphate-sugar epimerase